MKTMEKIRVGVIGVGNMGKHHARVYSEMDNVQLAAVSDLNEQLGSKLSKQYSCKFYQSYIDLLKDKEIDAVSIAVPTYLHKQVALDAIKYKKHVLLEKPIAENLDDANEIVKASNKTKLKLFIGHVERFNPAVQRLKKIIDDGKLGKITSIITRRVGLPPARINNTNVLLDLAVHDIDVVNYLLGKEPKLLYANSSSAIVTDSKDCAEILLKYGDVSSFLQVNWITPIKIRNIAITGTHGYAELDYVNQKLTLYSNDHGALNLNFDNFEDFLTKFAPDKIQIGINKEEPLKKEIEAFIDSIDNDAREGVTGEEATLALKIALEALKQDGIVKE